MVQAPFCIDDFGPLPVAAPSTLGEIGELIKQARAKSEAIYPAGGGTLLQIGLPPTRRGMVVGMDKFADVIDYPARDMTITVQSGITIHRLREVLRAEKQQLPVDVPSADRATLGGALSANISGPRRFGWGTFRDYVIGISMINDRGNEFKAGGRVVKNVAGYDICKLAIGALGTLGIITQVTLKLRPLAEEQALVAIPCPAGPEPILECLHATRTQPVCLELRNATAVRWIDSRVQPGLPQDHWVIIVGFEHNRPAIAWQVQQLLHELPDGGRGMDVRLGSAAESLWSGLIEFSDHSQTQLLFKANLLPCALPAFCVTAMELLPEIALEAHAGSGIVLGRLDEPISVERAVVALEALLQASMEAHGNLVIVRCPTVWKRTLRVWGAARDDWKLMHAVKDQFDPQRLFNPGRFVDGI